MKYSAYAQSNNIVLQYNELLCVRAKQQYNSTMQWTSQLTRKATTSCLQFFGSPEREGCASLGCSARPRRRARGQAASYQTASSPRKIRLISWGSMSLVSDIKLIRTDTTLDLSQKAEKGMEKMYKRKGLYTIPRVPENWTMNMG